MADTAPMDDAVKASIDKVLGRIKEDTRETAEEAHVASVLKQVLTPSASPELAQKLANNLEDKKLDLSDALIDQLDRYGVRMTNGANATAAQKRYAEGSKQIISEAVTVDAIVKPLALPTPTGGKEPDGRGHP